jgi:hypothetical protein
MTNYSLALIKLYQSATNLNISQERYEARVKKVAREFGYTETKVDNDSWREAERQGLLVRESWLEN